VITRRTLLRSLLACTIVFHAARVSAQLKVRRIAFLCESDASAYAARLDAFKAGMRALGYIEARDYVIERRYANGDLSRLPALAVELLALKPDLILTNATPSTVAASRATRNVPIVMAQVGDPVGVGVATTLRLPGRNVTGLSQNIASDLYTKRLDLLRELVADMHAMAFLYDPGNANDVLALRQLEADCAKVGVKLVRGPVTKAAEISAAFESFRGEKARGLMVSGTSTNTMLLEQIVAQAAKHRLPAIYNAPAWIAAGGVVSYGADYADLYRRAAAYAGKIFKGANAGELPIEQPTKFELIVNMKTARAIGITIPQSILLRADKVIE
jgi:putative tryptophan/tyrosine transport system substrate-binding protein